ncbi:2691_t:CDS:10, partial [Entrophospora sp. SA101]
MSTIPLNEHRKIKKRQEVKHMGKYYHSIIAVISQAEHSSYTHINDEVVTARNSALKKLAELNNIDRIDDDFIEEISKEQKESVDKIDLALMEIESFIKDNTNEDTNYIDNFNDHNSNSNDLIIDNDNINSDDPDLVPEISAGVVTNEENININNEREIGRGRGNTKRHHKILRDSIQGITKPAIKRLARRGGVKRIFGLVYEETRSVLKVFLEDVIKDAITYTEKPEPGFREIRINVELKQQENNIFSFPDLCKEADEFQFNKPSDDFFKRILENSEKYADEEEEEQSNRRKKRQEKYDVSDPFIDDSGMASFRSDNNNKSRPKIEGFYVWRGPLELENNNGKSSGKKRTYKRKKKDNNEEDEETGESKPRKRPTTEGIETIVVIDPEKSSFSSSSFINAIASNTSNNNNQTTAMDGIIHNSVQKVQEQQQIPKDSLYSSSFSNSNTLDDAQMNTLYKKRPKEQNNNTVTSKKIYHVESLNPELQQIILVFKNEVSKESFQNKSRFPESLKPILVKLLSKAYELGGFNENLFKMLTNILPYNKFTITRLCYRTMYPKAIHDARSKKLKLISQFKSSVDKAMPKLLKEYDERLAKIEPSPNVPFSSPFPSTPPPSSSNMDMDIDDYEGPDVANGAKAPNKEKPLVPKKFKWDNSIKSLLYQIIQTEMSIVVMSNQLAEAEERTERQSEQTCRKKLYQDLLTIWPDGWMSSQDIGK